MEQARHSTHVPLRSVKIEDSFWNPFMERVRKHVIPYQWEALNDRIAGAAPSYCMRNFKLAAQITSPGTDYGVDQDTGFGGRVFQDSDFAKWLEAVAYTLVWHPDPALEKIADDAIDIVCAAQQPDGYLNTYYIINGLDKRFTNLRDNHELYCLGHFLEAAIAYHEATGKDKLLNALIKYVRYVDAHIGPEEGKLHGYPGHEIIEMALVRLYEVTGDENHIRLAKYFIDQRGQLPLYFEEEGKRNEHSWRWHDSYFQYQYYQAGKPVREQHTAEGHAVRAVYLYSGMADIAKLTGDDSLMKSCDNLWNDIVNRQMYITGAIGQAEYGEAFSFGYHLPNDTAYAETCAAIGLAFFAKRMTAIAPKGVYGDVLEKVLFNGIISGMSLDGTKFFYVNPLEVLPEACEKDRIRKHVKIERQKWFGCACCPPNVARLVSSLGGYAYSVQPDSLYSHLYLGSRLSVELGGREVGAVMETKYPWEQTVAVTFTMADHTAFKYCMRIPGWCKKYKLSLNGEPISAVVTDGYAIIDREWRNADKMEIEFDMPAELIEANPKVREDIGKAAVMRGPMVYCLEEADNGKELFKIHVPVDGSFCVQYESATLEGVVTLTSKGKKQMDWEQDTLYKALSGARFGDIALRWIPYYAWANREPGEMAVWVNKL